MTATVIDRRQAATCPQCGHEVHHGAVGRVIWLDRLPVVAICDGCGYDREAVERRAHLARLVPHPVLAWFPRLDDVGLAHLSFDLQLNGLRDPVMVHGDLLLDGRARLAGCELARLEPRLERWTGREGEIIEWIISKNLHRRHLTTSQRSMIASRLKEEWAKLPTTDRPPGVLRDLAAAQFGVSPRSVTAADQVREAGDPDLEAQVDLGEIAVHRAAATVRPRTGSDVGPELDVAEPTREEQVAELGRAVAGLDPAELRQVLAERPARDVRAAVRTPRRVNDAYYTPPACAAACLRQIGPLPRGHRVLEPSVGGGSWAAQLESHVDLHAIDIDASAAGLAMAQDNAVVDDFLTHDFGDQRFDLIVGNPPFDEAEAHVRRALELLDPHGSLWFVLRRNFIGPARFGLLRDRLEPYSEWVLGPRVSFTGDGTDGQEYSLFRWLAPGSGARPRDCVWLTSYLWWRP